MVKVMRNFDYKAFIIGVLFGNVVICSLMFPYINKHYTKIYDVDIGHFCFIDNHVFQLQQLVDESKLSHDFKPAK